MYLKDKCVCFVTLLFDLGFVFGLHIYLRILSTNFYQENRRKLLIKKESSCVYSITLLSDLMKRAAAFVIKL